MSRSDLSILSVAELQNHHTDAVLEARAIADELGRRREAGSRASIVAAPLFSDA